MNGRIISSAHRLLIEVACRQLQLLLAGEAIPMLVLKGPHVAAVLYNDLHQRAYCDLDVLLGPKDFHRAARVLLANGFRMFFIDCKRLASQEADYQLQLRSPQGILIELHRALADTGQFHSDVDGFFQRSEAFTFGELKCRGLGTEDLLLHLCLHFGKRHFMTCDRKHLHDIALLIERRPVDWGVFLERARRAGCRIISYYCLMAARAQDRAELPAPVLAGLRPGLLRRRLLDRFIDPTAFPLYRFARDPGGVRDRFLNLMLLDTFTAMVRSMVSFSGNAIGDFLLRWSFVRRIWIKRHPLKDFLDLNPR